jgi:hypothetical protein
MPQPFFSVTHQVFTNLPIVLLASRISGLAVVTLS